MAAIFQIRRGTSNISITDGELYLHKGSGSIQFGSGSTPYNLLPLDAPVVGNVNLIGNITASSAYFSGDVAISGNLFLGNASNDTITAGGEFTSNLIPNPTNTYSLGSSTKVWKEVHATSISGAIAATNGVVSGSSQIVSALPGGIVSGSSQINFTQLSAISSNIVSSSTDSNNIDFTIENGNITANLKGGVVSGSSQISYVGLSNIPAGIVSASTDTDNIDIIITGGTISANLKGGVISGSSQIASVLESLNQFSSSINTATASLNLYTASNDTTNTNQNNRLSRLEESSQSLNDYTASLKTAISLDTTNVTILGNLTVNGTTTQINSTQVNIGENILELNYGGSATTAGIIAKDATGDSTTSGSLLWDATNDYWKAGKLGAESKLLLAGGDGLVSGSSQIAIVGTSDYSSLFTGIASATASLNAYTQSVNGYIVDLNSWTSSQNQKDIVISNITASYNGFTGSATASIVELFSTASNHEIRIDDLESKAGTLQTYTASVNSRLNNLETDTGSQNTRIIGLESKATTLQTYTASVDAKFVIIENVTASYNLVTESLNTFTASINGHLTDINIWTGSVNNKFLTLSNVTSSLNQHTESLNLYTSSTEVRLDDLEYTASISIGAGLAGEFSKINQVTASLQVFTSSANIRLNNLELTSASINAWSSSLNTTFATDAEVAAGYEAQGRGIVSGAVQIVPLLPVGTVSGSSQVIGILSSLNTFTSSLDATYATDAQVAAGYEAQGRGIVSGSSQITPLLPVGTVSGSSQVIGILNSLNSFTSSLDATYATDAQVAAGYEAQGRGIVSGSSQVSYLGLSNIPAGIVSGSIQVLGGSNILSGSNQTNITSINQNLGTTTTGVQFASLGIGTAPDGTYELKIAGDVAASGDIVAYYTSDKRLKNNIQPIENALNKVNELGGYTFDWNEELQKARKGHDIGVVAQEVQSILPEVVIERENGYLGVDYQKLVPVLIEAIKELTAKVELLENK